LFHFLLQSSLDHQRVADTLLRRFEYQIVKFYNPHNTSSIPENEAVQLFITDYTRNEQLMSYEDLSQIRLPGPYTLQISIYGHQAKPLVGFSRNPEEDLKTKFIHCRNIRPKLTDKGLLEATMFIDEKRPDKSDLTIFKTTERLKDTPWHKGFDAYASSPSFHVSFGVDANSVKRVVDVVNVT